jgi:hypothetical protein
MPLQKGVKKFISYSICSNNNVKKRNYSIILSCIFHLAMLHGLRSLLSLGL